jgi:hypothetical protein
MMNVGAIIAALDGYDADVELGIKITYRADKHSTHESDALLDMLSAQRDEAIDYLLIGRFVPLPDDVAIPAEWTMSAAMKRYVLDAPGEILTALGTGHDPRFCLLWAVKALCFIRKDKLTYDRIANVLRDPLGFDMESYRAELEATESGKGVRHG